MESKKASAEKVFFIIIVALILIVALYYLFDKFNITGRAISNSENVTLTNATQINQTNDNVNPSVISTSPGKNEFGVPIAQSILVNFDEELNETTVNLQTFRLTLNGQVVQGAVKYGNKTATFTPSLNLFNDRAYAVTLTTEIKDLAGNALAYEYSWNFTTVTIGGGGGGGGGGAVAPDTSAPTIGSTTIPSNTANVAINRGISVEFSEPMDASTINTRTFIVAKSDSSGASSSSLLSANSLNSIVEGIVSYANNIATFTPLANLDYNSLYTVTLTTGIKDAAGNALASNYSWNFTTIALTIQPQTPELVDVEGADILIFSWVSAPKGCLILQSSPSIQTGEINWSNMPNEISYENGINKFKINMTAQEIPYLRLIQVAAPCDISIPFVNSVAPANNASNAFVNKLINVTFSEPMDASTINDRTFILTDGLKTISGNITANGKSATFTPLANLDYNSKYTVTLTTGIKDAAGNALASNYSWNFTTIALTIQPQTPELVDVEGADILIFSWVSAPKGCLILQSSPSIQTGETNWSNMPNEISYENGINKFKINMTAQEIPYFRLIRAAAPCDLIAPTIVSVYPKNTTSDAIAEKSISARFSESMDASTINTQTFILSNGISNVLGGVIFNGVTAVFTPAQNLDSDTSYIATITNKVKDSSGIALENNYTWIFRTE